MGLNYKVWSLRQSALKSATPHESLVCLYLSSVQPLTELTSETLVLSLLFLPLSSLYTHEVKYISLLSQQSSIIHPTVDAVTSETCCCGQVEKRV